MVDYETFFNNCYVDYVKDQNHWHVLRSMGIGGSDAGIVMNVSNYKTPYQLWEEKTGKVDRSFITNEAIEKGNLLEPLMFEMFKTFYSKEYEVINTKNISLSSKQFPFLRANLDGALIERDTNKKGILEIKSSTIQNSGMLNEWKKDDLPIMYYFQCLHYLYVTGFDFVIVYAILDIPWANKQETRIVEIYKEDLEADIEFLIKTEKWFWNKVKTKTPPPFLEKRNKYLIN